MKLLELLIKINNELTKKGFEFILSPSTHIYNDGQSCSGYFDQEGKRLVIATSRKGWITTLVHEYGHFQQYLEGKYISNKQLIQMQKFTSWLNHEIELSEKEALEFCRLTQKMELDCERRALDLISNYNLSSPQDYIKSANCYIWFYEAARLNRKWECKKEFYDVPEILDLSPKYLISDLEKTPLKFLKLVKEKCFE